MSEHASNAVADDKPAVRGGAAAFIFVTINFVVDLLYVYVDPRIRILSREGGH